MSQRVILSHETTQKIGPYYQYTSCVLSDGSIIIYGRTLHEDNTNFHFFTKDGKLTDRTVTQLCGHYIRLLSLIITGTEYLAVSCEDCENIRLINLQDEDQEPILAYTSQEKELGPMCLGEAGTLYTVDDYFDVVSVLDCSSTTYILKSRLPPIKDFNAQDICYMDRAGFIALSSSGLGFNGRILAVSSDGRIVWNISPRIGGMTVEPGKLVYLLDQDLLLVGR